MLQHTLSASEAPMNTLTPTVACTALRTRLKLIASAQHDATQPNWRVELGSVESGAEAAPEAEAISSVTVTELDTISQKLSGESSV